MLNSFLVCVCVCVCTIVCTFIVFGLGFFDHNQQRQVKIENKSPPTPSGAPFPWEASVKFHVLNPFIKGTVDAR